MIGFISDNVWLIWALTSLLCLVLELTSGDFFIISLGAGCVGGAIASAFSDSIVIQVIVFAIVSLVSVFYVRPMALKFFHLDVNKRLSNADAIVGRTGVVTEAIAAAGFGRVQIDGDSWKAQASGNDGIDVGAKVRVLRIDSIILTVEKE